MADDDAGGRQMPRVKGPILAQFLRALAGPTMK
jgi:hypothetical protein